MKLEENMKNFKETTIPDVDNFNVGINKELNSGELYQIHDFYNDGNNKITKNVRRINEIIDYNSVLSKKKNVKNEVMGLYILHSSTDQTYVGISRTIIRRLKQHFYGKKHNESTLVYMMALEKYEEENNTEYEGSRADFPYENYRDSIHLEMRKNWKIEIIPETDSYKLYYMEIYIACKLKAYWNSFETH